MRPCAPALHTLACGDHGSQRQSTPERLRRRDHVRDDPEALRREPGASPAHAGLHLVEDQKGADLRRELAQPLNERRWGCGVTAFAEDGLDHDRRNVLRRHFMLEHRL